MVALPMCQNKGLRETGGLFVDEKVKGCYSLLQGCFPAEATGLPVIFIAGSRSPDLSTGS